MFRGSALSPYAVHLAPVIRSHADGYEISQRSLADSLGWRRETVRKYLGELITSGWLAVCEYKTAAGKRAFDEYHVHASRRFTDGEMAKYNRMVALLREARCPFRRLFVGAKKTSGGDPIAS